MFKNNRNILDNESEQVCRLCLAEEEDLIYIFNPKGYQGFRIWEIMEELLQMEVSKKDGLPWTICQGCVGKVKEFKCFKTTCIKAKMSYLTVIANRGLVDPTNAFRKRQRSGTSRKVSNEVEVVVKEEVVSEDKDPLREVTVARREEGYGGKSNVKDEMDTDIAFSVGETCGKENLFWDDSMCTGISNDAALTDPLDLNGFQKDADAGESLLEAVPCNQENFQDIESLNVGALNVVCLPLKMGECPTNEEYIKPRESLVREETHELDNPFEDYSRVTLVTNNVTVPQPVGDMIDIKVDADAVESCSEADNKENHEEYGSLDVQVSNVARLPLVKEELGLDKEEVDQRESLARDKTHGGENHVEDGTRVTSVSNSISEPQFGENMADGYSMPGGSQKMCEEIFCDQRVDRKENITKKFERNTGVSGLPVERSLRKMFTLSSLILMNEAKNKLPEKKGKSLKSGDYITSAVKFSDMMPSKIRHLDSIKKQLTGCRTFICDYCGVKYADKNKLVVHVKCHNLKNRPSTSVMQEDLSPACFESRITGNECSKQFKCEMCGKQFKLKSYLRKHYVVHRDVKPFKCETCGKELKRKKYLLEHSKMHLNLKQFICDICGNGFKCKTYLKKHLVIHSSLKPFKCQTCGSEFKRKYNLLVHSKKHHHLKPFKCETCGKGFKWKNDLTKHIAIHIDFKPFKCETCGNGFKWKTDLRRHLVTHSGLRPFKCGSCGKGYNHRSHLAAHSVMHSGLRPFKCETCGKEYKWRGSLRKHSIIHS